MLEARGACADGDGMDAFLDLERSREQAMLVARGVRPLAELGSCLAEEVAMLRAMTALERAAAPGAIPFVVNRGDGQASYGFAAAAWVVDLYRWVTATGAVPEAQAHRVRGLLMGYSAEAIRTFEEAREGRRFATVSGERASS